ncbi:MAG: hypothetical protein PHQ36_13955, partial [Anaerolineales bacterium]|nr:hypothetical protein [Anaerolineales bacterium]
MQRNMQVAFYQYRTVIANILQWVLVLYQLTAVAVVVLSVFFSVRWMQQPFLGAFYEHTLIFNGTGPGAPSPEWALYRQVSVGEQLTAINGEKVQSANDIQSILRGRYPGEDVAVTVHSQSGEERVVNVTLYSFPKSSQTTYFVIPTILSAIFLAASLWIFGLRRNEPAGRAFSLFTSSLAIVTGAYFNLTTTHEFTTIWTLACAISGGALFELALVFPIELRVVTNRPYLRWFSVIIGIVLAASAFTTLFNFENPTAYIRGWQYIYGFIALSGLSYIAMNFYHAIYAQSPVVKTQARTILIGALAAFIPLIIWLFVGFFTPSNFSPYLFLPVTLFPLTIGYTILRFRFLRTDEIVRRSVMYILLTILVVGGYTLLVTGAGLLFNAAVTVNNAYFVGAYIFVIALALEP